MLRLSKWVAVSSATFVMISMGLQTGYASAQSNSLRAMHQPAKDSPTTAKTSGTQGAEAVVHWNFLRQEIAGFGASGAFGQAANIEVLTPKVQDQILSLLFSTKDGAGLSIVRNLINDGIDGQTIEPSSGQWDWYFMPDDQVWLMQQAQRYGVKTFMSTAWSPPAWMKANDLVQGHPGDKLNYLLPKYYHAYAEYLAHYVNGYWTHFHLRISVVSIQNEPDQNVTYASCIWTPQQLDTFIRNDLIPVFKENHVQTKLMMPEQSFWGEQYALATLNDPVASKAVSIVAAHGYGGTIAPLPVAEKEHKQIWETEVSTFGPNDPSITDGIKWAMTMNQYLTVANVNAWNYWWLVNNGSDNEGLINVIPNSLDFSVNKRLYTMGNFSRFIRPGFYRIDATAEPTPGVYMSAYKNLKTGQFVVVMINDNHHPQNVSVQMAQLPSPIGSVTPYVTSATQNLQAQKVLAFKHGTFNATLTPFSVTSFVGK